MSAPQPKTYGLRALARALRCSPDTIRRAIDQNEIKPDKVEGERAEWKLETIEEVLKAKAVPSLRDEKTREEIRKLRLRNDRDEGKVILRSEVAVRLETYVSGARAIFEQRLLNEAPVATSGLEPAQIRIKNRQVLDEAWADMNKLKSAFL